MNAPACLAASFAMPNICSLPAANFHLQIHAPQFQARPAAKMNIVSQMKDVIYAALTVKLKYLHAEDATGDSINDAEITISAIRNFKLILINKKYIIKLISCLVGCYLI